METNDHFLENFKKSSSYLKQTKDFVQKQILEIENKLTVFNQEHKILSKEKLNQESDFVKFEILKNMDSTKKRKFPKFLKQKTTVLFSQKIIS
jgi:tRNA(Ile)-lysidine synthase